MKITDYKDLIEQYMENALRTDGRNYDGLTDSMRYSLMAGGKRIRPSLCLEFSRICGGSIEDTLPVAAAIEMIHTYSLIHDDLPCMDNDDMRRGLPTNHIKYGDCTATLAGDALQPLAFSQIMNCGLSPERKVKCASILADAAGYCGMCGGQYMDMIGEGYNLNEEELTDINNLKTGALLSASCAMGVAAAGGDEILLEKASSFGRKIGLAFQIRDDMLDVLATSEELGKPAGSDEVENKNTYMVLLGKDLCAEKIHRLTEDAISDLSVFSDTNALIKLAKSMENRKS